MRFSTRSKSEKQETLTRQANAVHDGEVNTRCAGQQIAADERAILFIYCKNFLTVAFLSYLLNVISSNMIPN